MSQTDQREEAVFAAALLLPAGQRKSYLDTTCGADPQLRQRVESRLSAHPPPSPSPAPSDNDETLSATVVSGGVLARLPEESPGDSIGRYKLLEKIGEGGFGVVYLAEQSEPVKRRVALKITKLGMDTKQVVARFEAERHALALMDHPNIATVIDGGATATGRPFFVMELVRGIRITEYCDQNKVPLRKRLMLFIQVCHAIEHAHQKGVIHRDIKPSNILVTLQDGAPVCKVIDFGIAKATQGTLTDRTVLTQLDQFIGTPAYMSPEQANSSGLEMDARSDIYSLGVLLYELLTGHTPFEAKGLLARGFDEMRRIIRDIEPLRPSHRLGTQTGEELTSTAKQHGTDAPKLISLVRGDLDWVVMKCLEKDRTRRYDTAAKLSGEIQCFLANQPVLAHPPSHFYRFQKLVLRNRLAFAVGAVFFTSLIAGLCVTTWFVFKEKEALNFAENSSQNADTARRTAEDARKKAEVEREEALADREEAEAALEQSEVDRAKAQAAEKNALDSQKEAQAARQAAEAALQQAQADRAKSILSEEKARNSQSQADAAESRATSQAGQIQEATQTAVSEATLRLQAQAAEAAALAEAGNLRGTLSNLVDRLAIMPPSDALKAAAVLFTPEDEKQPWAAQLLRQRGEWRARQGDWTNAMMDFSKALDQEPGDLDSFSALAPLLVQNGELEAYRRLCARFLAPSSGTNHPASSPLLAKVFLLAPGSGGDLPAAAGSPLAAARAATNDDVLPNRQLALGLAEYRQGRYAGAAEWAATAMDGGPRNPARQAQSRALLAMCQQQLNRPGDARAWLAEGERLAGARPAGPEGGDPGPDWREWAVARALLREAAGLVRGQAIVK